MQSGHVVLDSGSWTWQLTELRGRTRPPRGTRYGVERVDADPDAGQVLLLLEDREHPGDWMTKELNQAEGADSIEEGEVVELSREPDRRQLTDENGTVWTFEPMPRPPAVEGTARFERPSPRTRISRGGGPARTVPLPDGRDLGSATHDELLALVRNLPHGERESEG